MADNMEEVNVELVNDKVQFIGFSKNHPDRKVHYHKYKEYYGYVFYIGRKI